GTGTLRRNPDMKWKFDDEMVPRLVGLQRQIFEKAFSYVKPGGKIVYGTCSLLKEENQQQVEHFLATYDLELLEEPFQTLPSKGGMDGFFAAKFIRKSI
ncbi:MAG: RsmB/NOP family class I SAM-dependent RNA methyltransferase, partial [Parachlamydiaceae bacterium]|nr:RsmB/NOP family class I SAM-dependent RNA methyltransferase [Parachlamydiaceae bacterium]